MNNTITVAYVNEIGHKMIGDPVGTILTVLDPEIMEALGYTIQFNGKLHSPIKALECPKTEIPCFIGRFYNLKSTIVPLDKIVYLTPEMMDLRTGCARAEIEIIPKLSTAITKVGWEDRVVRNFLVPEDISLESASNSLSKVLRETELGPWLNTGGTEKLAELSQLSFHRATGGMAAEIYRKGRLLNGSTNMVYSNKYFTISIKLLPADQSEMQMYMSVSAPDGDQIKEANSGNPKLDFFLKNANLQQS